jgi:MFS family permease
VFLASYFWWFVMTWMPAYMTMARGFSTTDMGRTLSIPLFTMAVTNLLSGWAADRISARNGQPIRVRIVFGCIGLCAAGSLLLMNLSPSRAIVLPVLLACICGFGIGSASMWTIAQTLASSASVGRFIGYLNTLAQVAGAAAPLITGWTLGPKNNFHMAIWIAGVAPVLAAACLFFSAPVSTSVARGSNSPLARPVVR